MIKGKSKRGNVITKRRKCDKKRRKDGGNRN
jgi:hypothetical protein